MLQTASASLRFKRLLPHLLIVAIFIIVSCFFCYPSLKGKVLNQSDYFGFRYGAQQAIQYHNKTGKNAFWLNNMFSGMPSVMSVLYSKDNWTNILGGIFTFHHFGNANKPIPLFFWAMFCFYILMMTMGVNKWLALMGSIAFAFSSYNPVIIAVGHVTKMLDIAYLPAVIAGILLVYKGKYGLGIFVSTIFLAVFFQAGHYQIIYYGGILIGIIVIAKLFELFKKHQLKNWIYGSVLLLAIAGIAFSTKAVNILPVKEYMPYSIRGGKSELANGKLHAKSGGLSKSYAFQWSNGIGETLCMLVPNLYGGSSGQDIGMDSHYGKKLSELGVPAGQVNQMTSQAPLYWGPQPFLEGPVYFGAIICLLTVLSLFVIKSKFKWWLVGATIFFIFLAWGKNFSTFNYFMFDYFPFLNKFRTPSMALSIPSLLFPLLAIWALKDIFTEKISKEEFLKKLKLSLYIVGGLCVVILLASYFTMDFNGASDAQLMQMAGSKKEIGQQLVNAIHLDRASATRSDTFRSLIFVLLAFLALWAFAKGKIKKELAMAGMILLIGFDEIPVAHRYLNDKNYVSQFVFDQQFQPRPVDRQIMKDTDPTYRVMDLTTSPFNSANTCYFHNSVGGYSPAKLEIYQELIEHQLAKLSKPVLDMLNTKYLITKGSNGAAVSHFNSGACGPAWFVEQIKWAKNAQEAMDGLNGPPINNPMDTAQGNFEPLKTAILRDSLQYKFKNFPIGKSENAAIKVVKYTPDTIQYVTNNAENGLAVFSEIYYADGWKATIDGKPAPILRTDFALRALKIPAGKHKVEFTFMVSGYKEGGAISLTGSILLTLLLLTGVVIFIKKIKTGDLVDDKVEK